MSQPTFVGVQNALGTDLKIQCGGDVLRFGKDEVRIVEAGQAHFLLTRTRYVSDGKTTKPVVLFKSVKLEDALKLVKEPANASIAAAKKADEDKEKLKAEILADLKKDGWTPPKQTGQGAQGGKPPAV